MMGNNHSLVHSRVKDILTFMTIKKVVVAAI
jgi:hypothetical protein